MRKHAFNLLISAMILFLVSCGVPGHPDKNAADSTSTSAATTTETISVTPEETGVEVGGAFMVPSKNIVENASASQDHTTLVTIAEAAGLNETLSGSGPFTVFAPDNGAFNKLPPGTVERLLKAENRNELISILSCHVVAGAYKLADLKDGMVLTTLNGRKLKIRQKDKVWLVNDARITIPDVISSNGITYVIDSVLMPG